MTALGTPSTPTHTGGWRKVAVPYATARLAGQALEFLAWIVLARRLGASAFGELAVAFLICRYLGLVGDWGAVTRGPRDVAQATGDRTIAAYVRWRTQLSTALALVAAGAFAATGRPHLVPVVGVVVGLGWSRDWVSLGREQGWRAAAPIVTQGAALLAAALAVVGGRGAAWAVGGAYLAGAIASIGLNRLQRSESGGPSAHRVPRVDGWMLAGVLSNQLVSTVDTLLLGWLVSTGAAGVYAAVYRLPNAWIAVLGALLAGLVPVATCVRRVSGSDFDALASRALRTSCRVAALVALSAPVAALLVEPVFGDAYRRGAWACLLLVLATAVITAAAPLHPLVIASGTDRRYATVVMTGAALDLVLAVALIVPFGLVGAAAATLVAQIVISGWLWAILARRRT